MGKSLLCKYLVMNQSIGRVTFLTWWRHDSWELECSMNDCTEFHGNASNSWRWQTGFAILTATLRNKKSWLTISHSYGTMFQWALQGQTLAPDTPRAPGITRKNSSEKSILSILREIPLAGVSMLHLTVHVDNVSFKAQPFHAHRSPHKKTQQNNHQ